MSTSFSHYITLNCQIATIFYIFHNITKYLCKSCVKSLLRPRFALIFQPVRLLRLILLIDPVRRLLHALRRHGHLRHDLFFFRRAVNAEGFRPNRHPDHILLAAPHALKHIAHAVHTAGVFFFLNVVERVKGFFVQHLTHLLLSLPFILQHHNATTYVQLLLFPHILLHQCLPAHDTPDRPIYDAN